MFQLTPFLLAVLLTAGIADAQTVIRGTDGGFDGLDFMEDAVALRVDGWVIGDGGTSAIGAAVIDVGDCFLMPGLIDTHTHIVLHEGDYDHQILTETPEYRAVRATEAARKTLHAGITTIRDLGNEGAAYADVALRDAIRDGHVEGPDMLVAIQPVTSSGSYRLMGYTPYASLPNLSYAADGPVEVRKQVRRLVAEGADVVKAYMESFEKRQFSSDSLTGALNYTHEELEALVDEAHRGGLRVAAHVYTDAGARMALRAGVDTIEHGLYLSVATLDAMRDAGVIYVPTLQVYEYWRDEKIFGGNTPEKTIQLANTVEKHTASFRRAMERGVPMAFGSDTFADPGGNAGELVLLSAYGMPAGEVLAAGTSMAARAIGVERDRGRLAAGMRADIIGLGGDPRLGMEAVLDVRFVMKAGKVVLNKCNL